VTAGFDHGGYGFVSLSNSRPRFCQAFSLGAISLNTDFFSQFESANCQLPSYYLASRASLQFASLKRLHIASTYPERYATTSHTDERRMLHSALRAPSLPTNCIVVSGQMPAFRLCRQKHIPLGIRQSRAFPCGAFPPPNGRYIGDRKGRPNWMMAHIVSLSRITIISVATPVIKTAIPN
jgi:hypothetical protein